MCKFIYNDLIKEAIVIRKKAYAPYIDFMVGAALLCKDGSVYTGCNIESNVMSPNICAERLAIFDAIKDGKRDFEAIAIVGGKSTDKSFDYCYPCGICRQVMAEFCKKDFKIIVSKIDEDENIVDSKVIELGELLPFAFNL